MIIDQDDMREKLKTLLLKTTTTRKHSAYQILPTRLSRYIGQHEVILKPKYEAERLTYITSKINLHGKTAFDIGSNTGYFTFEMLDAGCKEVIAFEGGNIHSEFLRLAAKALGNDGNVSVHHKYFDFHQKMAKRDIALLLNVIHHAGDDYGDNCENLEDAKLLMLEQINRMTDYSSTLILQMGFNWKGDIRRCLFEKGTKAEMIDFVSLGTKKKWKIDHIGVAERYTDGIRYADIDDKNVRRDDSLGEFLNRPLFVMHKK